MLSLQFMCSYHVYVEKILFMHLSCCYYDFIPCPSPSSWCNNESWHCTHDFSSSCKRNWVLMLTIRHLLWVGFIDTTSLCFVQVHLGVTTGHGIMLMDHQNTSLHKALRPCRCYLGYRPLIEPRCRLMRPWCRMLYVKGLTHCKHSSHTSYITNLHLTLPILQGLQLIITKVLLMITNFWNSFSILPFKRITIKRSKNILPLISWTQFRLGLTPKYSLGTINSKFSETLQ